MSRKIIPLLFLLVLAFLFSGENSLSGKTTDGEVQNSSVPALENWVDSVFNSLTLDQRIAQLFIISAESNQGEASNNYLERVISRYNPGGICFFKGTAQAQAELTNRLQNAATTPLFVAMDAEWGPAMRLEGLVAFPHQITLGAVADNSLVYQMGIQIGKQLKRLGVNMSFSPVVDVNVNPRNPIINYRSFGDCHQNVAQKGIAYMQGIQSAGVIATAKHFPGHGDTSGDSHLTLPYIDLTRQEIDSIHLYPFRQLAKEGIYAMMVAHLEIPSLEPKSKTPSSLSEMIISNLLVDELGFKGLVITDALNMRGATDTSKRGELEMRALQAGNDILLMPENLTVAIKNIKEAINRGDLDQKEVARKVKKVLHFKKLIGLDKWSPLSPRDVENELNTREVHLVNRQLAEASITVLQNKNNTIPLNDIEAKSVAVLSIGAPKGNPFQSIIDHHTNVKQYSLVKNHGRHQTIRILEELSKFDLVIIGIHRNNNNIRGNYGINKENIYLVNQLSKRQETLVTIFANPYSLLAFGEELGNASGVLLAYQDGQHFEEAAAQVIVGSIGAKGRLPVSLEPVFKIFEGIETSDKHRVKFGFPEEIGINPVFLTAIDSIVMEGIDSMAFPGCQITVIKDGVVFYNKAFGHHTYDRKRTVELTDIYDLASITKVVATTTAIMHLSDKGKINVDNTLGQYLKFPPRSDKANITLRRVLAHNARLRAWIPFFASTIPGKNNNPPNIYAKTLSAAYPCQVADRLFIRKGYNDTIYSRIFDSELLQPNRYRYSDLGFILFAKLVKKQSGTTLDKYIKRNFFEPLGLTTMGFNPMERFPRQRIVPTEIDTVFRNQVIHGYVHDPTAAMMGGVAGHAGLFSNSTHLAIFMQMLLEGGYYAGRQYLKPETIKRFSTVQFPNLQNRRGMGFDKPGNTDDTSPACASASENSFGHMGFTGTYTWVDPDYNLVFVFLSNRTFPSASNQRINEMKIRTRTQQAVYDAIFKSQKESN